MEAAHETARGHSGAINLAMISASHTATGITALITLRTSDLKLLWRMTRYGSIFSRWQASRLNRTEIETIGAGIL